MDNNQVGKGDTPRPFSVDPDTYSANWNRVFNDGMIKNVPQAKTKPMLSELFTSKPLDFLKNWFR